VLADYSYTYDDAGRLHAKTENGTTTTFGYDDAGQLTQDGAAAHSYDATGNRTDAGYSTGDGNRLQSDGTWTYTYDDAGELIKKSKGTNAETWTYQYDHRGQLVVAEQRDTDGGTLLARVEYAYDAFGNRLRRTEWNGTGPGTIVSDERFAYDGWDTAKPPAVGSENFDAWADLDPSGNVTTRRLFGAGVDNLVARLSAAGAVAWYGTDLQGSVRLVFDNSGVYGLRNYTGFGAIAAQSGAGLDRYGYTGREWDATLGVQYSRARVYDPATGRFLTADPMGFAAGDVNLYRYVRNSPSNYADPSGFTSIKGGGSGPQLLGVPPQLLGGPLPLLRAPLQLLGGKGFWALNSAQYGGEEPLGKGDVFVNLGYFTGDANSSVHYEWPGGARRGFWDEAARGAWDSAQDAARDPIGAATAPLRLLYDLWKAPENTWDRIVNAVRENPGRAFGQAVAGMAGVFGLGKLGKMFREPFDCPSAKSVHDQYIQGVRPGAKEKVFETPWSQGKGLGSRRFDDFDFKTGTAYEGNTTPWSQMTQEQLQRKLDQIGSDFALLKTDPTVKKIVWFGTEPLPTTGLGGEIRTALEKAGIEYQVIKR
jgi:RHS repeat-associated protein